MTETAVRSAPRPKLALLLLAMIKHTLLCGVLALTPAIHAVELSFIRGPLQNTGVDADAAGTVRTQFQTNNARMYANLKGLTPGASYQLSVDGTIEADFAADGSGKANVQFRPTATASQFALDFDPRGKEIAVSDGTSNVLSMIYSGAGEPTELIVDERTTLARAETVISGRVEARYLDQKNKSRFVLHLLGLDRGIYTVRVAGVDQATVDLSKGRSALLTFEANKFGALKQGPKNGHGRKNHYALTFDPRGEVVELVAADGSVSFAGEMLAQIDVLPVDPDTTITLTPSGADADAAGQAVVSVDDAGETTLTVSVTALPVGDYQVWIGGAVRGTLSVVDDGAGGTQGELIFATLTTGTEVELDFPIAGQLEIKQGDTLFLSGSFD